MHVLIVNNDPLFGRSLSRVLSLHSFKTRVVSRIGDAAEQLSDSAFDAVLLESSRATESSHSLEPLRTRSGRLPPTLLVSKRPDFSATMRALHQGIMDVMSGPLDAQVVLERLVSLRRQSSDRSPVAHLSLVEGTLEALASRFWHAPHSASHAALALLSENAKTHTSRRLVEVIQQAAALDTGPELSSGAVALALCARKWICQPPPATDGIARGLREVERDTLLEAFKAGRHNTSRAAALAGIPRTTLRDKLRRYGVDLESAGSVPHAAKRLGRLLMVQAKGGDGRFERELPLLGWQVCVVPSDLAASTLKPFAADAVVIAPCSVRQIRQLLRLVGRSLSTTPVVVLQNQLNDEATLTLLQEGACDVRQSSISARRLSVALCQALSLPGSGRFPEPSDDAATRLLGNAPIPSSVRRQMQRLARYHPLPILVVGSESSARSSIARTLHELGNPLGGLVEIDCHQAADPKQFEVLHDGKPPTLVLSDAFHLKRQLQEKLVPTLRSALVGSDQRGPWLIGLADATLDGASKACPGFQRAISSLVLPVPEAPPGSFSALQRQTIVAAVERAMGNMSAAARELKIPRSTLRGRLERYTKR